MSRPCATQVIKWVDNPAQPGIGNTLASEARTGQVLPLARPEVEANLIRGFVVGAPQHLLLHRA